MKRYKYIAALLIGSLIGFSGCTDNFESDNEIKGAFNDEVKEYDYQKYTMPLEIIQSGIYFQYNWGDGINWPNVMSMMENEECSFRADCREICD